MDGARTVLIVEADAAERERLGAILERDGYDVVACFGPTAPEYACVGGRRCSCPLVSECDLVVLDRWLESDTMMMGTPSEELLQLYLSAGKTVITLGRAGDRPHRQQDEVINLDRVPQPDDLLRAVRSSAG